VSGGRGSDRARGKEKNRPGINRAELAEFIMIGRGKEMEIKNRGKYRETGPRGRMVLKKRRRGSGGKGMGKGPCSEGHLGLSSRESTAMGESGPPGNGVQKAKGEGETLHPTILAGRGGEGRGGAWGGAWVRPKATNGGRQEGGRKKQKGGNDEKKGLYRGARQTDPCV